MNCPKCQIEMLITEKKEIEIDYCPTCFGIWLDKGELEKIIKKKNEAFIYSMCERQTHSRSDSEHQA